MGSSIISPVSTYAWHAITTDKFSNYEEALVHVAVKQQAYKEGITIIIATGIAIY